MPPPDVPVLLPGAPPPSTKEATEQPESRYYSLEKMWSGTHPAVQGGIVLGLTVVLVMVVRALSPHVMPLVRILWNGGGDRADKAERTPDVRPPPYTPPPEPTEADRRMEQLLAVTQDMARKLQKVEQGVHNVSAEVSILDKRIGRIEDRLTTAVTREEMRIALDLVSELAKAR